MNFKLVRVECETVNFRRRSLAKRTAFGTLVVVCHPSVVTRMTNDVSPRVLLWPRCCPALVWRDVHYRRRRRCVATSVFDAERPGAKLNGDCGERTRFMNSAASDGRITGVHYGACTRRCSRSYGVPRCGKLANKSLPKSRLYGKAG